MKVLLEHRTYEQHGNEWIEIDAGRRTDRFLQRFTALAKTALVFAAIAALIIVAASLALILLPIAFLGAWWRRAASPTETRRPR
jgi:hypothetical protein